MRRILFLLLLATGLLLIGCGSNNTMTKNPGSPGQPGQPPPPPTPGTTQFSESMLANDGTGTVDGTVTVDTSGSVTAKLTSGGTANMAYSVAFCPFATGSCNNIGSLAADANGAGTTTFTMSGHGGFSGVFELVDNAGNVAFLSGFDVPTNSSSLQAALVRAGSVGGGMPNMTDAGFGIGSDALSSGSVTVNGGSSASLQVVGAAANQNYDVNFCFNGGGASCTLLGQLTTDAGGGGQASIDLSQTLGNSNGNAGVFMLTSGSPPTIQFVSGFMVP